MAVLAALPVALLKLDSRLGGELLTYVPNAALLDGLLWLQGRLLEIEFSTRSPRFWFGVAAMAMFTLLLFYPLLRRFRGWFQVHLLLGITAPVLILYHCNLNHGMTDANVALWTMAVVTLAGIVGHFFYQRLSANYHLGRQQVRSHIDTLVRTLGELGKRHPSCATVIHKFRDALENVETELLGPQRGLFANAAGDRRELARSRRPELEQTLQYIYDQFGSEIGLTDQLFIGLATHLQAFFDEACRLPRRSIGERLFSVWRLFHLPVFLVMMLAAGWHITKVWDWDALTGRQESQMLDQRASAGSTAVASKFASQAATQNGRTAGRASIDDSMQDDLRQLGNESPPLPPAKQPTKAVGAGQPAGPQLNNVLAGQPAGRSPPKPSQVYREAKSEALGLVSKAASTPPTTATGGSTESGPQVVAKQQVKKPAADKKLTVADIPNQQAALAPVAPQKAAPQLAGSPAAGVPAPATPPLPAAQAELQRKTADSQPPVGLGGPKRSLAEQFALFKQRKAEGSFSHSDSETGFAAAFVGKHTKADCASCHTGKPLREEASANPRTCSACHKEDDPHNGRRPNCVQCHTPTSFNDVKRKR